MLLRISYPLLPLSSRWDDSKQWNKNMWLYACINISLFIFPFIFMPVSSSNFFAPFEPKPQIFRNLKCLLQSNWPNQVSNPSSLKKKSVIWELFYAVLNIYIFKLLQEYKLTALLKSGGHLKITTHFVLKRWNVSTCLQFLLLKAIAEMRINKPDFFLQVGSRLGSLLLSNRKITNALLDNSLQLCLR